MNGRKEIVEFLVAEGNADPNLKNEFDRIPFEEALMNGFTEVAVRLTDLHNMIGDISKGVKAGGR